MIYCKLHFIFFLTGSIFVIEDAFKMEEIIGGYPASQLDFQYQAAIVGKYNYTPASYLLCGAAIISEFLLLSAARCFVYKLNQLKKLTFYAVVGADLLSTKNTNFRDIDRIYTYLYSNLLGYNDLAVGKLREGLILGNNTNLVPLNIPDKEEKFLGQTAIVSGFGINMIRKMHNRQNKEQILIPAKSTLQLKQANVFVDDREFREFQNSSNNADTICGEKAEHFIDICGLILADYVYEHRGICMADNGSPLVLGTKIIGVVSKHNIDCDDTKQGSIYTKVSRFKNFIDGLKTGSPIEGSRDYNNNNHLHYAVMPEGPSTK